MNAVTSLPAAMPLTMSSIEIAAHTGKRHSHVLADIRKTLSAIGIQPAGFSARYLDAKGEARECFNLPKRECLILISGYSAQMRSKIIDRWMELEAVVAASAPAAVSVTDLAAEVRAAIGGIVKGVVHRELAEIIPSLIRGELASQTMILRSGKTAGQIWHANGFPRMKTTCWFGNRLAEMGCQIDGGGRGEMGLTRARLFDPDKAETWLKNGGLALVKAYIAGRQGQTKLRLVQGAQP